MQENDLKTVTLTIAGRQYPVKVTLQEELVVKELEDELNAKINEYQNTYAGIDKLDCVIMTLLTYTFDLKKSSSDAITGEALKKINDISDLLTDVQTD